jgi:hypothetical protein
MNRVEEWDFPSRQTRKYYRSRKFYRTIDVYQPGGWGSPVVKKVVHVYSQVMLTAIKMLFALMLSLVAVAAFGLFWVIVTL